MEVIIIDHEMHKKKMYLEVIFTTIHVTSQGNDLQSPLLKNILHIQELRNALIFNLIQMKVISIFLAKNMNYFWERINIEFDQYLTTSYLYLICKKKKKKLKQKMDIMEL